MDETLQLDAIGLGWEVAAKQFGGDRIVLGWFAKKEAAESVDCPEWADYLTFKVCLQSESSSDALQLERTCKQSLQVAAEG